MQCRAPARGLYKQQTEYDVPHTSPIRTGQKMHRKVTCTGCRYNPIKTIKTSFIGTMNMLGLAKRTHARFLLTSTSEVCL